MSKATLIKSPTLAFDSGTEGKPLGKFSPHDLRRTASTLLHEAGYNTN